MGRAVTQGLSGLDKRKSWLMSNSGNVAWRYRWSGWGLGRTRTDKRKGEGRVFLEGGGQQKIERLRLCCLQPNIYGVIVYLQILIMKLKDGGVDVMKSKEIAPNLDFFFPF